MAAFIREAAQRVPAPLPDRVRHLPAAVLRLFPSTLRILLYKMRFKFRTQQP